MTGRLFKDMATVNALAEKLERCAFVNRYSTGRDKEGWTIAHAFADLEESFDTLRNVHFPKILFADNADEIEGILLDIGEEFRHILYHLKDPKFYDYLEGSTD
jgi:hypothetical protein